jgi:hypothetical protein
MVVAVLWVFSMLATAGFTATLGTPSARAEEESPPEVTAEPSDSEEPPQEECSASASAGEVPTGSQAISGTVTFGGSPVEGLTVSLGTFGNGPALATQTNPLGEYQFLDLGDGSYTVAVNDGSGGYVGGFWDGAAAPVAIDPADATPIDLDGSGQAGVDVELTLDSPWTVLGTLTDHLGQSVGGATIRASGRYLGLVACADAGTGSFSMTNVDSGVYVLSVTAPGYPTGYYKSGAPGNFTSKHADASLVAVDGDLGGIAIAFPELFELTGFVRDGGGAGVEGFSINAREDGDGASGFGSSIGDGSFVVGGLPAGNYQVSFSDGNGQYRSGWYGGDGAIVPEASAATVTVPGPAIEIRAELAPTISGRITDAETGDGVYGSVAFCDLDQIICFGAGTDPNGFYTAPVLEPATYYAQFFPNDSTRYPSGGYIGTSPDGAIVQTLDDAAAIPAGVTDVEEVNGVIPVGGRIEVRLTAGGSHVDFPYVQFCLGDGMCGDAGFDYDAENDAQSVAYFDGATYYAFYDEDFDGNGLWLVDGGVASPDFADATPLVIEGGAFVTISSDVPATGVPTSPENPHIALDDGNGNQIEMSFAGLEDSGVTTVSTSDTGIDPPAGFQLGVPATYYDFTTTVTTFTSIQICIPYAGVTYISEAGLRLFHYDEGTGAWEDITDIGYPDVDNDRICGTTTSLSPFVLAERQMAFTGFFQPVDNGALNKMKAGAAVPVKFSLGGDFGLNIFAEGWPQVSLVACDNPIVDTIEQTIPAGSSHLTYDVSANQYIYIFKSAKTWAGGCRMLQLTFTDGTTRSAVFNFTK